MTNPNVNKENVSPNPELARELELDKVDVALCDIYAGENGHEYIWEIDPDVRDLLRQNILEVTRSLRAWRLGVPVEVVRWKFEESDETEYADGAQV